MGEVYEATQLGLDRRVAIKVLHTDLGRDDGFRRRFQREGRLQAALEHPNIVAVYEAGEIDDGLFLAMRLVSGVTLKQLIVEGELNADRSLRLLAPIAGALDAAHAAGLVHRDVKPQNILVDDGDRPFLADFGLTRGPEHSALTRSGQVVGTIDYIAPEQVRGEPAVAASDIYAFSAVLYECLTGSVPYARPSDAAVLYAHVSDDPPSVGSVREDLPAGLDSVVARGMAKEPDDRPASAGELIEAAAVQLAGSDAAARSPSPPGPVARGVRAADGETAGMAATAAQPTPARRAPVPPTRRRRGALLAGLGLVALAAVAFLGGRALGGGEASLVTSVSSAGVSLRAPSDWRPTGRSERPAIPGLALRQSVGVARDRSRAGVVAGFTAARGAQLLPAGFVRRSGAGLPRPDAVKLGRLDALRYEDVELAGFDRGLTVFASPSTAGVVTIACYAQTAVGLEPDCGAIAQTAELLDGRPYPLAASPQTERTIRRVVASLARRRSKLSRGLAQAMTGDAQAAVAAALAGADRTAARRLKGIAVGPALDPAVAAAASALAAEARAYLRLAASARAGDASAYDRGRREAQQMTAGVESALAELERGGR